MATSDQDDIDARIQVYYADTFDENARLTTRSAQGPLEFQRTQELIRGKAPAGRVIDIGGGSGIHATALRDDGYDVVLVDPVQRHVDTASAAGIDAHLGDARALPFASEEFDIALLLGPLYHLSPVADRRVALAEALRVLKPGGVLLTAALSRYVAFGSVSLTQSPPPSLPDDWAALLVDGTPSPRLRFPAGHLHTAEELHDEVANAGFEVDDVVGVEGPAGLFLEVIGDAGEDVRHAALVLARAASATPGIRDQSAHLIAIARRPISA
ncbi:class I SAM-dependent methyltransferase [Microbacterium sp. MYb62]|uniref:class I SAM-dependent methyltransferase n=1 Tax=Microbacterium sp. MYb62 TaxID=1848690 RepID=UPI000CFCDF7F|nr:class I SAM-dependent methyltransferase [Microbacterium sp. MYb62]PRB13488.1 SAM-dependent methyltransferase [Microbacterium sp. MYb62]